MMRLVRVLVILGLASLDVRAQIIGAGAPGATPPPSPMMAPPAGVPATGAGAISGVVVDALTGAPLPDVLVSLGYQGRGTIGSQSRQLTDERGRFVFVNLPAADTYTVSSSKFGYLDGGFVRENAAGGSGGLVVLTEGDWVKNARIVMWRPGAIGGTVVDERGEPVVGVYVRALSRVRLQGRDELAAGPLTRTDDRGMYRLSGLVPAKYVIQVPSVHASVPSGTRLTAGRGGAVDAALDLAPDARLVLGRFPVPPPPIDGRSQGYPIAFHPGTQSVADAVSIDLQRAEDRTGVDIRLAPMPTARVSGTVDGPPEALTKLTLRLVPAGLENLGQGSETATALVGPDGRFTFLNVPAGSYVLDAPRALTELTTGSTSMLDGVTFAPPPGSTGWGSMSQGLESAPPGTSITTRDFRSDTAGYSGRTSLVVGGRDIFNVVVPLRRGATMSGQIVAEADPGKPSPSLPLGMLLDPAIGSPSLGMPRSGYNPDNPPGQFMIQGIQAGEYFLRPSGTTWIVKSIQWKGRDYTDTPFDTSGGDSVAGVVITITNAVPVLTGTVREPDGTPAAVATVIAFPVDRASWINYGLIPSRIKSTAVANTGGYRLNSLPAGDYYVLAVSGSQPTAWQDPEFFKSAETVASRVTLSWGNQSTRDLTVTQVR